jgi:hypothetical protein
MAPPLTGSSLILHPPTGGYGYMKRILCSLLVARKHERVAEQARDIASAFKDRLGCRFGGISRFLGVGMVDPQHDQAGVRVVGHVLAGLRERMHARKLGAMSTPAHFRRPIGSR